MDEFFNQTNAWTVQENNEAWLYSDASAYYAAFVKACQQAKKSIVIVGWDFHSDTVLTYKKRRAGLKPKRLLLRRFLQTVVRKNPQLQVYVLTWDYAPVYLFEREKLQSLKRGWMKHPRIHFHLDDAHPISASQHQKFVVVDADIAFVGGLDLTIRRWDDAKHSHEAPFRKDPYGEPYGAFHDYQLGMTGPIVFDFLQLFRDRWEKATGNIPRSLPEQQVQAPNPLPADTVATFENATLVFSRTMPAFRDQEELTEISQLFSDLIQSARQAIVIENQYLTAHSIVKSLGARLEERDGPEVIIILPEKAGGWLEIRTMGMLQDLAIKRLRSHDKHGRLRIYFPRDEERARLGLGMTVHSKIMIVDEQYFSIGSANLNNRSMGYDTECQITIDAARSGVNQKAILDTRAYILAHHCEVGTEELQAAFENEGSLIRPLDLVSDRAESRFLEAFPPHPEHDTSQLEDLNWLDMEKPTAIEQAMDQWGFASEFVSRKLGVSPRIVLLLVTIVFAVSIGVFWHFVFHDAQGTEEGLRRVLLAPLSDPDRARFIMPLVFAVGAVLFIPINLMIIITASVFSTSWAFLEIALGVTANVLVGYALGRLAGHFIFARFFGKRTQKILDRIGQGQFLTILFIRVFPIAPGALINLAAGSGKVPFFRFLCATLLGMAPGTIMLVLFQKSIIDVFRNPGAGSIITLVILGLVTFGIFRWSRRRFSQYRQNAD